MALRSRPSKIVVLVAVVGALVTWYARRDGVDAHPAPIPKETREALKPVQSPSVERPGRARFDFYLLAMSVHSAFCADGHSRMAECAVRAPRPLVIHGLWPEDLQPGAYPHDCPTAALDLAPALAAELEAYMPGMRADLHEHEWRKHGGCTGLDDDVYWRDALTLARVLDEALAVKLTTSAGQEVNARELRNAADAFRPGLGATLVFQCRTLRNAPAEQRKRAFLIEVRQCVDDDGPDGAPGTPLDCATVKRRDQGCGGTFMIAGAKPWK